MKYLFLFFPLFAALEAQEKTVLITGANRGLGLEFAKQFNAKGYDVIGTARSPQKATELNSLGVRVEELDVAEPKSIEAFAKRLKGVPIDILINNAGIFGGRGSSIEDVDFSDMEKAFIVNSIGPMRVTQALLPNLRAGNEKKIINISSQMGSIENSSGSSHSYRASKAALNMLSKNLSIDLASEGFIVIAMHPGWVQTDMGGQRAPLSPEESILGMMKVIESANRSTNGKYLDLYGNELPW